MKKNPFKKEFYYVEYSKLRSIFRIFIILIIIFLMYKGAIYLFPNLKEISYKNDSIDSFKTTNQVPLISEKEDSLKINFSDSSPNNKSFEVVKNKIISLNNYFINGEIYFYNKDEIKHVEFESFWCQECKNLSYFLSVDMDGTQTIQLFKYEYNENSYLIPKGVDTNQYKILLIKDTDTYAGYINLN